ncbi:MAG: hypothetical protein H7326_00600 [Bdellovibrionaceae bacterium]|nr:hypothetical protein [Pseudobdellovibrionaceae bacterium]
MNSAEQIQDPKNDGSPHQEKRGRCGGARRFLGIPIMIAFLLVKSGLVFFLWNELIPQLFHGPMLTYLQAVELMILAKLLVDDSADIAVADHGKTYHKKSEKNCEIICAVATDCSGSSNAEVSGFREALRFHRANTRERFSVEV